MSRLSIAASKPSAEQSLTSPAYPTAAAALTAIGTWGNLTEQQRAAMRAAVRAVIRNAGRPAEAIRLDPAELARTFLEASPASLHLKPSTLSAYRNGLRRVLRRLGLLDPPRHRATPLPEAWQVLVARCPERFVTVRLQRFLSYCAEQGLAPGMVTDATLADFLEQTRTRRLTKDPHEQARRIAQAWNRAADLVVGWPTQRLAAPPCEPRQYSLPFEAYPSSLQRDIAEFRARISVASEGGLFTESGPRKPLRAASVKTRMVGVRLALGALVQAGTPPETIGALHDIVRPAALRTILDWHWRRAGRQVTANTGVIAETLRIVAKYHVGITGPALAEIARLTGAAKPPKRNRMTARNESILAALEDPHRLAMLLHLPRALLAEADALLARSRRKEAAWLAGVAAAVEIELHCPMRLQNLSHLRIGDTLVNMGGRQRFSHFMITNGEVKNSEPIVWPVAEPTSMLLDRYLTVYRPALTHAGTDWLFPHRGHADRPRLPGQLSNAISHAIWKYVGVRMHTHAFRAFAGAQILRANPGALEDLRLVLGHRGLETALTYYASIQPRAAAERLSALTQRKRSETEATALAAFARQGIRLPPRRRA